MSARELLQQLRDASIEVWIESDTLRYRAPAGSLTEELRAQVRQQRPELIRVLRDEMAAAASGQRIPRGDRSKPRRLSFAQQRLWLLDQISPGSAVYTMGRALRLSGPLNLAALGRAFEEVQRRHDVLRTNFRELDGDVHQSVGGAAASIVVEDLRGLEPALREELLRARVTADVAQPFDLANGPLIRGKVYLLGQDQCGLVLTCHHIVSDGVSDGLLFRELSTLYEAFSSDRPSPLPDLPVQYADFAEWQRARADHGEHRKQLEYWKRQLRGSPSLLELPTDRRRPPIRSFNGNVASFAIAPALAQGVEALARRQRMTPFVVYLGAFVILLHKLSRQDDIVIGTAASGRDRSELESLIGFFINTLPLRLDLSENPSLADLLNQARSVTLDAFENADVPLETLIEEVGVARQTNANALIQVMFALQPPVAASLGFGDCGIAHLQGEATYSKFDLTWSIQQTADSAYGVIEYSTDLFDSDTIERMTRIYCALLAGVVRDATVRVSAISCDTGDNRDRPSATLVHPTSEYPRDLSLIDLLDAVVARAPTATAIEAEGRKVTYAELNRLADRLAQHLAQQGVREGVVVGLLADRGIEMIAGMIAILKAGGAYLPLDPSNPTDRTLYMLQDAAAGVVLAHRGLLGKIGNYAGAVQCFEDVRAGQDENRTPAALARGNGESLAYVMYTSGSTGHPKGTTILHRSISRLVINTNYVEISAGDRIAQAASAAFDAATFEIWGALLNGACVVVAARELTLTPVRFARWLREDRVSVLWLTVSLFNAIVTEVPDAFRTLRYVLFGGEAADPRSVRKVLDAGPPLALVNGYGPTESTTFAVCHRVGEVSESARSVPIGKPISNTSAHVLDESRHPVPIDVPGELYLGGDGLALGYLNLPELTAQKFLETEFGRLYRTGDLVRWRAGGVIDFLGRADQQVKIRGFRVEPGEIEATLIEASGLRQIVVVPREVTPGDKRLIAYCVDASEADVERLKTLARARLPDYMVPAHFVRLAELPVTINGKLDRNALPPPLASEPDTQPTGPMSPLHRQLVEVWREVLAIPNVGIHQNFFDVGGNSLLLIRLRRAIVDRLKLELNVVDLFANPTVDSQARMLSSPATVRDADSLRVERGNTAINEPIAIVGMAGRFPDAADVETFWENLRNGRESIRLFDSNELAAAGASAELLADPRFVPAKGALTGADLFDAGFFSMSGREADLTDPQQRVFLEVAWEAVERAGYDPARFEGPIGLFGGASRSSYLRGLEAHPAVEAAGSLQTLIGTERDFLVTRASYKLDLRGPSVNVQTACSTSLVAVHMACQSLRAGDCDLALAGGVSISSPTAGGYFYQPDGILSPDGHCRPFDAQAKGTVPGNGVGVVVLQRLSDAQRCGATIRAVILGSAVNNDGSLKVGYTAPAVQGQAAVIARAQAMAGIEPSSIGYVEAHGTGTSLGDPIEVEALRKVFGTSGPPCALGSLKSNMGHLDAAAGVASLIKAALCVEHAELVPSLHFAVANPELKIEQSPFVVTQSRQRWTSDGPRRAGISSFGIGGTNAHVVLQEAPQVELPVDDDRWQVLPLSARNEAALDEASIRLADFLESNTEARIADVAHTLQVGRQEFEYRRAIWARDRAGAIVALRQPSQSSGAAGQAKQGGSRVVFLFPGQGSQYPGMARDLYDSEPTFRSVIDRCAELTTASAGFDFRDRMWAEANDAGVVALRATLAAQLSLFAVELALARLWMSWGVVPSACLGHSIGEYVAAVVGESLTVEEALRLVVLRGTLMSQAPEGAMVAVLAGHETLAADLADGLWISAMNGPDSTVVAGNVAAIDAFAESLQRRGTQVRRLATSGAFHSGLMRDVAPALTAAAQALAPRKPTIPYVSNVTGTWATPHTESADYWARHLMQPVHFLQGVEALLESGETTFLEVGPGQVLTKLARRQFKRATDGSLAAISSLREGTAAAPADEEALARAMARLWARGARFEWAGYRGDAGRRVTLPTYPFQRQHYGLVAGAHAAQQQLPPAGKNTNVAEWFYLPTWRGMPPPSAPPAAARQRWMLLVERDSGAEHIASSLESLGHEVLRVVVAPRFMAVSKAEFQLDSSSEDHWRVLVQELQQAEQLPTHFVHALSIGAARNVEQELAAGYECLRRLLKVLMPALESRTLHGYLVSSGIHAVNGSESLVPPRAALLGMCRVAPQEYPGLRLAALDVEWPEGQLEAQAVVAKRVASDLAGEFAGVVALRGRTRWLQTYERLSKKTGGDLPLRRRGVYVVTGGLGGVGLLLARYLAREWQARLVLISRTPLPARESWSTLAREDSIEGVRTRGIQGLEQLGSEVLFLAGDVADGEWLESAFAQAESRFGPINGVIHAAGTTSGNSFAFGAQLQPDAVAAQFAPKVYGTLALADVLRSRRVDFCACTSSLSTVLGGLGFSAYVAANCVLEAIVEAEARSTGTTWISSAWDGWRLGAADDAHAKGTVAQYAMRDDEAIQAFLCTLQFDDTPRLVVSTTDLGRRVGEVARQLERVAVETEHVQKHARPELKTRFAGPRSELETKICATWREMLAIEEIGIHDDFFELGGDSLLAVNLMFRLGERLATPLSTQLLFKNATVATLAEAIAPLQDAAETEQRKLADVIALVEGLSDEEVRQLLAEEAATQLDVDGKDR